MTTMGLHPRHLGGVCAYRIEIVESIVHRDIFSTSYAWRSSAIAGPTSSTGIGSSSSASKFPHPSDPSKSLPKGHHDRDNLHQVSKILKNLSKTAVPRAVAGG